MCKNIFAHKREVQHTEVAGETARIEHNVYHFS